VDLSATATAPRLSSPPTGDKPRRSERWQWVCFFGALLVYALTRFTALERFPIYFFCDEAIHSVCAQELAAHHFSIKGEFLPTYFRNFFKYNLSLSVYVQGLSGWLFGQSIWTVRATSAAFSLTSAAALALLLRRVFGLREWWLGAMLLAATPVWLLHSRTGFETVLMVSCYSWFLCFYLLYRYRDPRWIFPAMLAGAGVFYAYSNGQGVMAFSAVLLMVSDARYHWRQRTWAGAGLGFALMLFVPYLRFRHNHPGFLNEHFRDLDSFVAQDMSWHEKALAYAVNYLHGLSPRYWFFPGQEKLVRHETPGYGHFFTWLLPFYLLGVGVCLRRWRESRCRALLIAMLAAPFSAALAGINACRTLEFVVPANAAIALGLSLVLDQVRSRNFVLAARGATFAGLALTSFTLLGDNLTRGPSFGGDYGIFGMQWGARELMRDLLPGCLKAYPNAHVYISPSWSNGINAFVPFFRLPEERISFPNFDELSSEVWKAKEDDLMILPAAELARVRKCVIFGGFDVLGKVSRPDGHPGFYVGKLRRAPDWEERLAGLRRKESEPIASELQINGQPVTAVHPPLEVGIIEELFDGIPRTVARCARGIPMVIELRFPQPRTLEAIAVHHRDNVYFRQNVTAFVGDEAVCTQANKGTPEIYDPVIRVPLGGRALDRVRIEVEQDPECWVHLRDIELFDAPMAQPPHLAGQTEVK
jgi:hypothetical protein